MQLFVKALIKIEAARQVRLQLVLWLYFSQTVKEPKLFQI